MPNKRRSGRRRVVRKRVGRRRAGSSQRFANRRNIIRLALKSNPTAKDLYYIPLTDLVPSTEPLPETDEQLHKVSCNVTIVTNNNVTGCSYQMGIAGPWAFDENTESSDFLPLTSPKMLKSTRPTRCIVGIPEPTRHIKGVLSSGNSLAIKVYPVCDGQVNSATLVISTNSVFKLAIKEPQPVDVGTIAALQSMSVSSSGSSPSPQPANSVPVPQNLLYRGLLFDTTDKTFPLTYTHQSNTPYPTVFDVTAAGNPIFAGILELVNTDYQSQYDKAGYLGNIASRHP